MVVLLLHLDSGVTCLQMSRSFRSGSGYLGYVVSLYQRSQKKLVTSEEGADPFDGGSSIFS